LAWISGQKSKLDAWMQFDRSGDPNDDPYMIIGRSLGHPEATARAFGKIADLAFGYQGGVSAWQNFAPEGDASDEATIKRYRDGWRNQHPAIVRFWYALDRAAISAIRCPKTEFRVGQLVVRFDEPFLRITLPSGRAISYPFPRIETNRFGDLCVIFKDNAAGKWTDCKFGQGAYGGLWAENVVSGIARDLLGAALMRLEAAGYPVILHVHDEVVCETPDGFGDPREFKQIITALPEWAAGLPVAAKVRNGPRFAKVGEPEASPVDKPKPEISADSDTATPFDDSLADLRINAPETTVEASPGSALSGCDEQDGRSHGPKLDEDPQPASTGGYDESETSDRNGYSSGERRWGQNAAEYIYSDASGEPYLRVVRTTAKQFPQYHWHKGQWLLGKPNGPKIPYRLPELIAAAPEVPVFVTEGEKDADRIAALGLLATTNSEGAGKWSANLNRWFAGKKTVFTLEDNDAAGRAHVANVANALHGIVPDIRIVSFLELPEHGDVSDWIDAGGTKEALIQRANTAPKFERPLLPFIDMSRWDEEPVPEQRWAVFNKIPRGQCVLFSGEGATGKSTEGLHLSAAHVLERGCWHTVPEQGSVIYVDAEDGVDVIHRRLAAVTRHYEVTFADLIKGGLHLISLVGHDAVLATSSRSGGKIEPTPLYQQLLQAAGDIKPIEMIIASSANVYAGSEIDRSQVQQFIGLLTRLAIVADGSVVLISHPSLNGINTDTGLSGSTQWHNAVRARFYMKGVKSADGEQPDDDLREIVFKKNQYGPISDQIVLRWQDGMYLPVPGMASLDQAAHEARADEIFLDLLRRFTKENRFVSDKPGRNYAPALFAKEEEAKREMVTSKAFEAALRRLFKAGTIWNELYGKPSRQSYRIALRTGG
jgi:RecA-family ATPase